MGPPKKQRSLITLEVRGGDKEANVMALELSEPQPGEECCIAMDLMATHRVEWMGEQTVVVGQPHLTKATLPCGHGFHALTLLYHFAKNEMTCPCCRHGFARQPMAWASLPPHLKPGMEARLERVLREEREAQVASDTQAVSRLLESELQTSNGATFMIQGNRQALVLFAYPGMDSLIPPLVQELPLTMTQTSDGMLEFATLGSSVRELNRNLRMLPVPLRAFEVVAVTRSHGMMLLARSERFERGGTVPCVGGRVGMAIRVRMGPEGFEHFGVGMPREALLDLMLENMMTTVAAPGEQFLIMAAGDYEEN
jgi:hypothetical protein